MTDVSACAWREWRASAAFVPTLDRSIGSTWLECGQLPIGADVSASARLYSVRLLGW